MNLNLRFFATFREAVGSKTVTHEFEDGMVVREILAELEAEYDGLEGELLTDGGIKPHINVLLNGREVLHLDGPETALEDGDTLSVFPPVASGANPDDADLLRERPMSDTERMRAERSFRGISQRLATHYLTNLGGAEVEDGYVEGDGWTVELSEEKVSIGPTVKLNEVTVVFEGEQSAVDAIVERFAQKAMRAGG